MHLRFHKKFRQIVQLKQNAAAKPQNDSFSEQFFLEIINLEIKKLSPWHYCFINF